ncbi:MAG: hypothetical protein HC796_07190 [Synechococcaceae cyanobacterium RL_1_2]|nr:hypothetical protein [Synechococcaceae cyanobacterium RL_1_2]
MRQPLYRKPGEEIALGIAFDRRSSKTTLADNLPFPSLGSDDNGETRLSMLRFSRTGLGAPMKM